MIYVGLTEVQKQAEIVRYAKENGCRKVIVFSPENMFMQLPEFPDIRQIGYKETIMYRTFYPLLSEIDDTYLLVMNEMMRDRNRSCLTYNCVAKYTNQTPHRLVFQFLPCMDEMKDIMILLDFDNSQRYKGRSLSDIDIANEHIQCNTRDYAMEVTTVCIPQAAEDRYKEEKEKLFAGIGNKDPNTIPRQLELLVGKWKLPATVPDQKYVARNARFHRENIIPYSAASIGVRYTLIDIQHSRKSMNDFFFTTEIEHPVFISTGLPVDVHYVNEHRRWRREVEQIYAQTGVYSKDR